MEIAYISSLSQSQLQEAANLVRNYSWGPAYPQEPMSEIVSSELHVGAVVDNTIVGYSGINRFASPDGVDNGELWFVHAVVHPDYRRSGIWKSLYQRRLDYVRLLHSRVLCCTDNPNVKNFLLSKGWFETRQAVDSNDSSIITVLELIDRSL